MKKVFRTVLLGILFLSVSFGNGVFAQAGEQITLFKSEITLEKNTDIKIREEIHYYFSSSKHGIIREIPVDYKVAGGFKRPTTLHLNDISYYKKDSLNPQRFDSYERSGESGYAIFKIGDSETTIQGEYVFVIDYTLKNAVNYFDDHDELYLNITGNGWNIPISTAYAILNLPGEITERICFTGRTGSEESQCSFEDISNTGTKVTVNTSLEEYEGYTVALKMPKGTLEDTTQKQIVAVLISNIGVFLPVPLFFFLVFLIKNKGKNKKLTIIPHYKPNTEIFPLLGGYIYNKVLNNKHITAQIIQLAVDGFLKIEQGEKKDYTLVKEKDSDDEFSQTLMKGLFKEKDEVNTKSIPSDFYITFNTLNRKIYSDVYSKKYFDKEKRNLKTFLLVLGIISFFVSFVTIAPLAFIAASGWSVGLFLSATLLLIFSFQVDVRSEQGNRLYYELEGLKMYINTAEKHRIQFHNDPKTFRGVFEKLLPYAIIFGLEKKWVKEFEDIYDEPPTWYRGNMDTFNTYLLVSSIGNISKNVQARSVAPNSAGGFTSSHGGSGGSGFSGGSSGGGFGGGGGGSW